MILITIIVGLVGGFFTSRTPLTPELSLVSSLFILVFALPTYYAWISQYGIKKGIATILTLSLFAIVIESIGVQTGWPYGRFFYEESIGEKILGIVPWTVPFAWVPLVLGSYTFVSIFTKKLYSKIFFSALFLVAVDLVLDPGAYALRMWIWIDGGQYYGVPLVNFLGWLLSGTIGTAIITMFHNQETVRPQPLVYSSLFLTLSFWSSVAFFKQLYIPFVFGLLLLYILITYVGQSKPQSRTQ
jgi:putative membrane protein